MIMKRKNIDSPVPVYIAHPQLQLKIQGNKCALYTENYGIIKINANAFYQKVSLFQSKYLCMEQNCLCSSIFEMNSDVNIKFVNIKFTNFTMLYFYIIYMNRILKMSSQESVSGNV